MKPSKRQHSRIGEAERREEDEPKKRISEYLSKPRSAEGRRLRIDTLHNLYRSLQEGELSVSSESEQEERQRKEQVNELLERARNRIRPSSLVKDVRVIKDENGKIVANVISIVTVQYLVPKKQLKNKNINLKLQITGNKYGMRVNCENPTLEIPQTMSPMVLTEMTSELEKNDLTRERQESTPSQSKVTSSATVNLTRMTTGKHDTILPDVRGPSTSEDKTKRKPDLNTVPTKPVREQTSSYSSRNPQSKRNTRNPDREVLRNKLR